MMNGETKSWGIQNISRDPKGLLLDQIVRQKQTQIWMLSPDIRRKKDFLESYLQLRTCDVIRESIIRHRVKIDNWFEILAELNIGVWKSRK